MAQEETKGPSLEDPAAESSTPTQKDLRDVMIEVTFESCPFCGGPAWRNGRLRDGFPGGYPPEELAAMPMVQRSYSLACLRCYGPLRARLIKVWNGLHPEDKRFFGFDRDDFGRPKFLEAASVAMDEILERGER